MKILATILGLSLVLAASGAVLAAEKEEVMMRDGTTALVEVVETTPDSVTVKFKTKTGASGQAKLRAAHALVVGDRLEEMTGEMEAVIELVTGARADAEVSRTFRFPD